MRHLTPVQEAACQLVGISPTTFYALIKEGGLSLVKIGPGHSSTLKNSTIS